MLYRIIVTVTLTVLATALVALTVNLVETGNIHLASFLVVWIIVGGAIPLWLIYRHNQGKK